MRSQLRRTLGLVLAVVLLLSACSSSTRNGAGDDRGGLSIAPGATTPPAEPGDGPGSESDDPVAPGASTAPTSQPSPGGGSTDGGTAPTDAPDPTGGGGSSATSTGTGTSGSGTAEPPPADTSPIRVGVIISGGDPGRAVGAEGFGANEDRAEAQLRAVIEHINANGGYGGHPVEMIFDAVDQTDQSDNNQERLAAEMCEKMTQDEQVHLVISLGLGTVRAHDCYAKRQTPVFELTNPASPESQPWIVPSTWLGPDRMAALMPHAFEQMGFLTQKMGVMAFDREEERAAVDDVLIPGIEARGGKVLDVGYVNTSSYGDIAANISSAVLRFKSQGVDRVIMFAKGGGVWLIFTQGAESQDYRPRYGISTWDFPVSIGPLIPERQHQGAAGVGFLTHVDNYLEAIPEPDARQRLCWQIVNDATGSNYENYSQAEAITALGYCEGLFIAQQAFAPAAGRPIAREEIPGLYRGIGTSFDPFAFDRLNFNDRSLDAITVWSPIGYDQAGCACFRYTDGWRTIP